MFHCAGLVGLCLLVQLQTLEVYQHHPVDSGVVQAPEDVEAGYQDLLVVLANWFG